MKRFKSILCASLITLALSSSALAGDISTGRALAGDISTGKATAGVISTGQATGDVTIGKVDSSTYADFAGYLLMLLSTVSL